METDKAYSAIRSLIRVRNLLVDSLSPASSLIPIDLLLVAGCVHHSSKPHLTVKQLFAQLRHSDRAVRMHFNRLVADGMLIAEPGPGDRRTKVVRLSPRGEKLLQRVATTLAQSSERPPLAAANQPVGARPSSKRHNGGSRVRAAR
jgi:DNA-binding MarR family transcriptional regulator